MSGIVRAGRVQRHIPPMPSCVPRLGDLHRPMSAKRVQLDGQIMVKRSPTHLAAKCMDVLTWRFKSGRLDSNWRIFAPKAGAGMSVGDV